VRVSCAATVLPFPAESAALFAATSTVTDPAMVGVTVKV
jgi:hypothetical protein